MTDDLPFDYPTAPSLTGAAGKQCRRHEWYTFAGYYPDTSNPSRQTRCRKCDKVRDEAAHSRGKSARRLGGDQERRIERVYGPEKIGERGDPVDHLGRFWKWQSKATRRPVPQWLDRVTSWRADPLISSAIYQPIAAMTGLYGDRYPLLIWSFVRTGVPVRDFLFVWGHDWEQLHGPVGRTSYRGALLVMTGQHFLDVNGKDTP